MSLLIYMYISNFRDLGLMRYDPRGKMNRNGRQKNAHQRWANGIKNTVESIGYRSGGARSHDLPLRRGALYPTELRLDKMVAPEGLEPATNGL